MEGTHENGTKVPMKDHPVMKQLIIDLVAKVDEFRSCSTSKKSFKDMIEESADDSISDKNTIINVLISIFEQVDILTDKMIEEYIEDMCNKIEELETVIPLLEMIKNENTPEVFIETLSETVFDIKSDLGTTVITDEQETEILRMIIKAIEKYYIGDDNVTNDLSKDGSSSCNETSMVFEKDERFVMYIVVNGDLKMTGGKIASQVGHVVGFVVDEIIRSKYEQKNIPMSYHNYMKWMANGCAKIVLKGTTVQLLELSKEPETRFVIDSGLTQIPPNSLTAVAFYPRSDLKEKMKDYKLFN